MIATILEFQQPSTSTEAALAQIDILRREIAASIALISSNSLDRLEVSLSKQEVLCIGLQNRLQTLAGEKISKSAKAGVVSAMKALHLLTWSYAKLVDQSRASNGMFYALCSSFRERGVREASAHIGSCCSLEV